MLIADKDKSTIINLIKSIEPNQFKGLTTKIKYLYPDIYKNLVLIKESKDIKTISEILYLIINDMDDVPECVHLSDKCCGKLKFKNIVDGYFEYCKYCTCLNEDFIYKREETNLEKYGVKYPTQNKNVLSKITETNMKKYGVRNVKQILKGSENGRRDTRECC